jgi:citrate synthase
MVTGTQEAPKIGRGLEGVVAAQCAISAVDGKSGILLYRGYAVADLADNAGFEEVAYLLLEGKLPNQAELDKFHAELVACRAVPAPVIDLLRRMPRGANVMSALRTAVSLLGQYDPTGEEMGEIPKGDRTRLDHERAKAVRMIAQFATIVCAFHRIRSGLEPVAPDPGLRHAANFLYMLTGKRPGAQAEKAFDVCLVLHAEHGFNASTFSARVTVATLTDFHSAMAAAIGTLKGPLHGGANEQVMVMLDEIKSPAAAADWVRGALAAGRKIMGFGHRVYKTYDPRARILREWSRRLGEERGEPHWFAISDVVEKTMKAEKNIDPNVDFYSATVYHHLGIATDLFTPIFAVSRIAGWCAHVLEQLSDNRLIRPLSEYTGPHDLKAVPLAQRT